MCDLPNKLVAWTDGELPQSEAAAVARHVEFCSECRECLATIELASNAFNAYCDVAIEQAGRQSFASAGPGTRDGKAFHWTPVACGIGAIAAAAVLAAFVMQPHHQVARSSSRLAPQSQSHAVEQSNGVTTANGTVLPVTPLMTTQRHGQPETRLKNSVNVVQQHRPPAIGSENIAAFAAQPPIEISVPAEDMFPPGAVPDGISYSAVVTFTADGVSQRFGNAPVNGLKAGFDRGGNRP